MWVCLPIYVPHTVTMCPHSHPCLSLYDLAAVMNFDISLSPLSAIDLSVLYVSIRLSIHLYVHLAMHLPIHLAIHLPIHLSIHVYYPFM